jgi:hypothetical protein
MIIYLSIGYFLIYLPPPYLHITYQPNYLLVIKLEPIYS